MKQSRPNEPRERDPRRTRRYGLAMATRLGWIRSHNRRKLAETACLRNLPLENG